MSLPKQLEKKLEEMTGMLNFMLSDLNASNTMLGQQLLLAEKTGNRLYIDALIRMRVRAVVSFLESACFYFRHISRDICEALKREPLKEFLIIEEGKKVELKDKIKLSLRFLAYSLGKKVDLDLQSRRWQSVCSVLDKRHLITHPTSISELQVDENDLEDVNNAMFWFVDFVYKLMGKPRPRELDGLF